MYFYAFYHHSASNLEVQESLKISGGSVTINGTSNISYLLLISGSSKVEKSEYTRECSLINIASW